jgi:hypothetical protein
MSSLAALARAVPRPRWAFARPGSSKVGCTLSLQSHDAAATPRRVLTGEQTMKRWLAVGLLC